MPTAPNYGLLGLAQGLGNVPQSYEEGQNSALALKLRGIQAQNAQRELSQAQAEDQALSMPVAPKMQTTPAVMSPSPEAQVATNQQNIQGQINSLGDEGQNAGPGEFTPSPQTVIKPAEETPYEHLTPYGKAAYEMEQRAQRLSQLGMGRSAFKFQQEAMQLNQMHQEALGQKAVRALSAGSSEAAVPLLKGLGLPAKGIIDLEGGSKGIEMDNGEVTVIDPELLMTLSAPGAKLGDAWTKILQFQTTSRGQDLRAQASNYKADRILEAAVKRMGLTGEKATAFMKNSKAWQDANPGLPLASAMERFLPKNMENLSPNQKMNMFKTLNAQIAQRNGGTGWTPDVNSKDKNEREDSIAFNDNVAQMKDLVSKGVSPKNMATSIPKVTDAASYASVQPGAQYYDPNGVLKTKGK